MPRQPSLDFGMFVRAVAVEDRVDQLAGRRLVLDGVEETDELLLTVALHAAADHIALDDVEGGKQRGGAVPLVVARYRAGPALLRCHQAVRRRGESLMAGVE
jgi:hypothetical protein